MTRTLTVKRKRTGDSDMIDWESGSSASNIDSDGEIDIASALVGKRQKTAPQNEEGEYDEDDDEHLQDIIRESIAKRDKKGGTEVLKQVKGKNKMVKGEVGGGSFQSMGLYPWLLRSLTLQGYRTPTPIQRLAIPSLLSNPPRDLVGMARTGSGKSLAYMVPLVQRLGGRHSTAFGARALILLPARELALQVLKVGKELARGWHAGEGDHAGEKSTDDSKKSQGLRWGLVVGGEGMDEQFEMITNNPDIIIATPGRLLHLIVEMNLDLKSVQYVVFDEADRLFEMGFETALTEILGRLPATRQTLLFSATLPKSLVEFAKAGLQNPKLVRLDAETKISTDLRMAFFSVKQAEKDASLFFLLRNVIGVPLGSPKQDDKDGSSDKKGKGNAKFDHVTAPHQTLIFAATKHHVEYLTQLLLTAGYSVSQIYGSLDQSARTHQMDQFRRGLTNILVVTDVAARGIDIPVLENVVNYDFPQGARVFVHRVGRTARAGRTGWAWSFVMNTEMPYLLDLQLFLARPIKSHLPANSGDDAYTESLILGTFERTKLDEEVEFVRSLDEGNHNLLLLRDVMRKGHSMYERSKGKASQASYKRAKEMMKEGAKWGMAGSEAGVHPVLLRGKENEQQQDIARKVLLQKVNAFRPVETVFEVGSRGKTASAQLMKDRRKALDKAVSRVPVATASTSLPDEDDKPEVDGSGKDVVMADEEEIAAVFDVSSKKKGKEKSTNFRDEEFYMSYHQAGADTEKGYSLRDGASFIEQARNATFDLTNDEGLAAQKRAQLSWDKKKKKFVKGAGEGADNVKLVKTENGVRLPATYRSGRFDEWKTKSKVYLPRVGEAEPETARNKNSGKKFKHNKITAAKPLDKLSKDYERKTRQLSKKGATAAHDNGSSSGKPGPGGKKGFAASKRYGGKPAGRVKSELKNAAQIRKDRKLYEQKKVKNARAPRRKGKR
ncbi:DEAD-domain-containing protein [Neolentinus lepideus HHB14362 ss-1]|uniref:RNA helicase n=1 Tax=Neolentinus lepideus HHB14362 ss-1 TaxID=1314782 RepID=A0A165V0W6_9AGAM|nr:DEAD-domain-containing protein [Neolentinus lepideus HHB14362 ss-1]